MKLSIGMKAGIGLMILAFTNPNEEMLRNKIYEKKEIQNDDSLGSLATLDVAKLNRMNFLAFSIASVRICSEIDTGGTVITEFPESGASIRIIQRSVYDGETRYIGMVGNWFKLSGLFQSY
jgi:hypothetical protein